MDAKQIKLLSVTFLFSILLTAATQTAYAQARAGIKGGLNVSNLYIDNLNDENARFGFNLGIYGQLLSSDVFAIQPELLYSTKGSKAFYGGVVEQTVQFNLNYLDLPVLAVIKLGDAAEIHLGAYASLLLGTGISYSGDVANGYDKIEKDQLKSYDYGLAGGFGLNFGQVQIGARYNYGLVKIAKSEGAQAFLGDSRNSVAQLYLALNLIK